MSVHLLHEIRPTRRTRSRNVRSPPTCCSKSPHKNTLLHRPRAVFLIFQEATGRTALCSSFNFFSAYPSRYQLPILSFQIRPVSLSSWSSSPVSLLLQCTFSKVSFSLILLQYAPVRCSIFMVICFSCLTYLYAYDLLLRLEELPVITDVVLRFCTPTVCAAIPYTLTILIESYMIQRFAWFCTVCACIRNIHTCKTRLTAACSSFVFMDLCE